jgi:hypothetical protein
MPNDPGEPAHAGYDSVICGIGEIQPHRVGATPVNIEGHAGKDGYVLSQGLLEHFHGRTACRERHPDEPDPLPCQNTVPDKRYLMCPR